MTTSTRQWLEALGLSQYADVFEANDVDADLLSHLSDQVLKDIGVASAGHRLRILAAIAPLAGSGQSAAPAAAQESALRPTDGERRQATPHPGTRAVPLARSAESPNNACGRSRTIARKTT